MEKRKSVRWFLIASMVLAIGSFAGCNRGNSKSPKSEGKTASGPPVVHPVQAKRDRIRKIVEQPGTIQAHETTQIFSRVSGYVRLKHDDQGKIVMDIGKRVQGPKYGPDAKVTEPGEILAEVLVPELEEELNQKHALAKQSEAELEQSRKARAAALAGVAIAEASVLEAKALYNRWESESARVEKLVKSGTIDAQARDEAVNQFKAAAARVQVSEAAVRKANADRDKADADVLAASARVDVAKADTLRTEAMVGFAKIRAPFDGVITHRKINSGDLVQAGSGKGESLFTVARLDPVRVVIGVPEADAEPITEKMEVKLSIPAMPGTPLTGVIRRTSWALDPGSRTLRAEIDLPNKEGKLRPGMYVYTHITQLGPECLTVPATAVIKQNDILVCYILDGDKVKRTPVQIGRSDGERTELRKVQKAGSPPTWIDVPDSVEFAANATGLSDGLTIERGGKKR